MATRNPSLNLVPSLLPAELKNGTADDNLFGPRPQTWWTGLHPTECPGYDAKEGVLKSLALPNLRKFTRESVLAYFDNAWTQTEVGSGNRSITAAAKRLRVEGVCRRASSAA
jgi:hypothetical protein